MLKKINYKLLAIALIGFVTLSLASEREREELSEEESLKLEFHKSERIKIGSIEITFVNPHSDPITRLDLQDPQGVLLYSFSPAVDPRLAKPKPETTDCPSAENFFLLASPETTHHAKTLYEFVLELKKMDKKVQFVGYCVDAKNFSISGVILDDNPITQWKTLSYPIAPTKVKPK